MSTRKASPVIRLVHQLVSPGRDGETDGQLLQRFLVDRDEAAFAGLVHRHGPMVMAVCRRVLQHHQDAEDAFQATFMVLARKVGSIARREALASWLFGVAYRVAIKARGRASRRRACEMEVRSLPLADPLKELAWRDLRPILDAEINRLSDKYRLPFVLCCMEGQTNEEAARQVGCPVGTIVSRLARARRQLRERLRRRGLAISAGGLATFLSSEAGAATPSPAEVQTTIGEAIRFGAGLPPASIGSLTATHLAKGVLAIMFIKKAMVTSAVLAVIGLMGFGATVFAHRPQLASCGHPNARGSDSPSDFPQRRDYLEIPSYRDGVLLFIGTEIQKGDEVAPEDLLRFTFNGEEKLFRRLKEGDWVGAGQLLGMLDPRLALDDCQIKVAKVRQAELDMQVSQRTRDEAKQRYLTEFRLSGGRFDEKVRGAKLTWERYVFEAKAKETGVELAKKELEQAETILKMHELRTPVSGRITAILVRPGEAVRALQPILQIKEAVAGK